MMKAKILKPVFVAGMPCAVGDVVDVSRSELVALVAMGKAEEASTEAPSPAPVEVSKPARRKAKSKPISNK